MLIPYLALAFVISAVLSAATLHVGTDLLCTIRGREKRVSTDGLNGFNWWPFSILASTGASWMLLILYGWQGLKILTKLLVTEGFN